jgi:signal transduction histidine kinase
MLSRGVRSSDGEAHHAASSPRKARRAFKPARFPLGTALLAAGALIALAVGTTWLLQRGAVREARARAIASARSQAELVAQAAADAARFGDSTRLMRILECATRDGGIAGGAILDSTGLIVAHTDVALLGSQVALPLDGYRGPHLASGGAIAGLFEDPSGEIVLQPLLGPQGPLGFVVLRPREQAARLFDHEALRILLPASLLLLAFVGMILATIRWAVRPTAEFLEHLTRAFEQEEGLAAGEPRGAVEPEAALDRAVRCVDALHQEKQALLVQTRLLGYEKKRLARILDRLPEGLLLADTVGRLVYSNRSAATWLGSADEGSEELRVSALPPTLRAALAEASRTGQAELRDEGQRRLTRITRVPLSSTPGHPEGDFYILRDESAQLAAQRAQAEFLSQISHELKAPLNTIVTFVEALIDGEELTDTERKSYFNTLNDEALRMARLIANLMQLSRIQLGNLSAQFGFVKPSALILQQAEALRAQAEGRGQTLELSVPENLPALYGDKDLIGVALTNLLANAVKYTGAGGHITVRALADEGGVRIEVADTGIGIPAEEQERVFERFARSSQPEVQAQPGSGLGLALVREIAEIHEGQIQVSSEPGRGSVFRLWLPCREVGTRLDVAA